MSSTKIEDIEKLNSELITSIEHGDLEAVKSLVGKGTDISMITDQALLIASKFGHTDIVKYLIDNGVVFTEDKIQPRLLFTEDTEGVMVLPVIQYFIDNFKVTDAYKNKILDSAASFGNLEVVKYITEINADVQSDLTTPLSLAIESSQLGVIQHLVEQGANPYNREFAYQDFKPYLLFSNTAYEQAVKIASEDTINDVFINDVVNYLNTLPIMNQADHYYAQKAPEVREGSFLPQSNHAMDLK